METEPLNGAFWVFSAEKDFVGIIEDDLAAAEAEADANVSTLHKVANSKKARRKRKQGD